MSRRSRWTPWLLGAFAFAVYIANFRPMGSGDTIPARLLPFSIAREADVDLDEFHWLRPGGHTPYFLHAGLSGRWYSKYPVATPMIAAPAAVPAAWWLDRNSIGEDDVRFRLATLVVERLTAAAVAALSVVVLLLALRCLTTEGVALATAVTYAFGSGTWSISSQALWQHGPVELCLSLLCFLLLRWPEGRRVAVVAGLVAAFGLAVRPTFALILGVFGLYFWFERRRDLLAFALPSLFVGIALYAYNATVLGKSTGGYHTENILVPSLVRFAGLLLSPNRGLLVFTPLALLGLIAAVRPSRNKPALLRYAGWTIGAYLLVYSGFRPWWAGFCYGPRYLTDVLPVLAICAVPLVERISATVRGRAALAAFALWGVTLQAIGVYFDDGEWNREPAVVDAAPERIWRWNDLHVLRAVSSGFHGADLLPLLAPSAWQAEPALLRPLNRDRATGRIDFEAPPVTRVAPGGSFDLLMRVTNLGAETWPAFSDFGEMEVVVLAVWTRDGETTPGFGGPLRIENNVAPGKSAAVDARLRAPREPGSYEVAFDIVQRLDLRHGQGLGTRARTRVEVDFSN